MQHSQETILTCKDLAKYYSECILRHIKNKTFCEPINKKLVDQAAALCNYINQPEASVFVNLHLNLLIIIRDLGQHPGMGPHAEKLSSIRDHLVNTMNAAKNPELSGALLEDLSWQHPGFNFAKYFDDNKDKVESAAHHKFIQDFKKQQVALWGKHDQQQRAGIVTRGHKVQQSPGGCRRQSSCVMM